MTNHRRALPYFAFTFFLIFLSSAGMAAETSAAKATGGGRAVWAWAGESGNDNAIFISRQTGDAWEQPQKISTNDGVNIVPSVANPAADDLMVVWSSFIGGQAQLRYRQMLNGQWTEEKEYYTGLSSNMAPSVVVDRTGTIWLVWAGFNGISDEIFYTRWDGNDFATATPLTSNDVPDIQPVLGIDEAAGNPVVQWLHFSENGYVKLESSWNGSAWNTPATLQTTESADAVEPITATQRLFVVKNAGPAGKVAQKSGAAGSETEDQMEIEVPPFITSPESASIHIPGYTVQSLPVRSVVPVH